MYEYVGNLHAHTPYSDGEAPHDVIAAAAVRAGLDFVVVTDHNILVQGVEGYYRDRRDRRVLLLTGEEIHDPVRVPQRSHLLVYGVGRELASYAYNTQGLIDAVNAAGGSCFIAHPFDQAVPWAGQDEISWDRWDVSGYTGLELWNYMSLFKALLRNPVGGLFNAHLPSLAVIGPDAATLAKWDELLRQGQRVAVIGNADAHGTTFGLGPLRKVLYPYEFLFRCVNTHVLLDEPLGGDWETDGAAIYRAIAAGRSFVGYGLPGNPRGFHFEARHVSPVDGSTTTTAVMGGTTSLSCASSLSVHAPATARLRLIHDGQVVAQQVGTHLAYTPTQPGAYRVEAWRRYLGRERGWIFSNPIYLTP